MERAACPCGRGDDERLPSEFLIAHDDHWSVVHAYSSGLLGWLILQPRRHVIHLADLTDEEAAGLGVWQVRLARALAEELGTPKAYVAGFGESPGSHLHFHVVARPADLAQDRAGPGVFGFLAAGEREKVSPAQRAELAARLRARLAAH
ncbi:Diadenosine tetraphosphate (Ap4A) hydrolase [Actinopolymorpha cephalotaxi]|uniref:Diadenosine tetraphosphate (Ap4A) HIT family hydrolase n=1 Tax=Actinopolymorpha cephalotaxi TaxID=504797 RepID=A0A1I2M2J3_9ACTN|nr:HIT family protein [Actinopolymorpha cephalotaxi]NYH81556.1 diadenosine tetraphosphate (Ap4A) HIT family hydrolase [Actinopolymorpha cephalotaxi]SFF85743.1 Diadenosine tetraphosphate (Ap4A) hydrolase [Actinopolymorpha cephalotaxi]